MLDGPMWKVLPDGCVQDETVSGLKVIVAEPVSPSGDTSVAVPLLRVNPCVMHPEPSHIFGPDLAFRFPSVSATAVSVGQVMVIGGPDIGVRVKVQVNISVSPGVRELSVVEYVIVYEQQSSVTTAAVKLCAEAGVAKIARTAARAKPLNIMWRMTFPFFCKIGAQHQLRRPGLAARGESPLPGSHERPLTGILGMSTGRQTLCSKVLAEDQRSKGTVECAAGAACAILFPRCGATHSSRTEICRCYCSNLEM